MPGITGLPLLIAGPCALETEEITFWIAAELRSLSEDFNIPVIFKGSYAKANRTRENSFHGVGIEKGLELLYHVKCEFNLPVTSDVHEVREVERAAEILDVIQIPALLCKNTDILHAAGDTGKTINIKKGHFVTADDMYYSIEKVASRGNEDVYVTERGNQFGYADTIVDFRSIAILKSFGYPVIFDATHSVRNVSRRSDDPGGGTPEAIGLLTRCAAAVGADGLFVETHVKPAEALCDSVVCYPLKNLRDLVKSFLDIRSLLNRFDKEMTESL